MRLIEEVDGANGGKAYVVKLGFAEVELFNNLVREAYKKLPKVFELNPLRNRMEDILRKTGDIIRLKKSTAGRGYVVSDYVANNPGFWFSFFKIPCMSSFHYILIASFMGFMWWADANNAPDWMGIVAMVVWFAGMILADRLLRPKPIHTRIEFERGGRGGSATVVGSGTAIGGKGGDSYHGGGSGGGMPPQHG